MKFKTRPVTKEATQWFKNGDHPGDECWLVTPVPGDGEPFLSEGKVVRRYRHPGILGDSVCLSSMPCKFTMHDHGWIDTPEGGHNVCPGDWIITGLKGEFYPCKPDIFVLTYEPSAPEAETGKGE